jgi:putative ATPase
MDLFDHVRDKHIAQQAPLADRMRPRTLDEFVGQAHIVGPGRLLRRAIQADQLSSLIFYGPPGTGKTTLARIIANTTRAHFIAINAVLAGVKDIREAIDVAQQRLGMYGQRTILFVDEVHRFNKAQQDALLPHVENGTVILIGATTENPYFEVIKALVSRSRIFALNKLDEQDLLLVLEAALRDEERGYGALKIDVSDEARAHLVDVANGDARGVLNALELAVETTPPNADGVIQIDLAVAEESIQRRAVLYDKDGDAHFDTISAFIKSMRGSDPDAALYWMARMLYAGEDARFILRRMLIFAGEDVGLADPHALRVVTACAQAFDYVGLPEGRFHLAEACLYLATAPKSNSTMAFFDALNAVEREQEDEIPAHLKDSSRDADDMGHGKGYLYPHAYRDHWVAQQYLPQNLQGKVFYQPSDQGYEAQIQAQVSRHREAQLAAMLESSFSPLQAHYADLPVGPRTTGSSESDRWLQRTVSSTGAQLAAVRDRVMAAAGLERHSLVLDINAGTGLLTWEAVRRAPVGGVWALAADNDSADALRQQARSLNPLLRPVILAGDVSEVAELIELRGEEPVAFDVILGRNSLIQKSDKAAAVHAMATLLAPRGRLSLAEVLPRRGQRLYHLVDLSALNPDLRQRLAAAEEAIYNNAADPMVNWDASDLEHMLHAAGLSETQVVVETDSGQQRITAELLQRWFTIVETKGRPSYAQHLLRQLTEPELAQVQTLFEAKLHGQWVDWATAIAYVSARK